jgi:hypothetical protein
MVAMPVARKVLVAAGANMSNFFIATPICCPSRTALLAGRFEHNNKVGKPKLARAGTTVMPPGVACAALQTGRGTDDALTASSSVLCDHHSHFSECETYTYLRALAQLTGLSAVIGVLTK